MTSRESGVSGKDQLEERRLVIKDLNVLKRKTTVSLCTKFKSCWVNYYTNYIRL